MHLNITKSDVEHPKISKWRKTAVYVFKILEMLVAFTTIVVIRQFSYYYVYTIGVMLASCNIITTISTLAMALAEDFSRFLDIANLILLTVLYFITTIFWCYRYFLYDRRFFVLIIVGLSSLMLILFVCDFFVHYIERRGKQLVKRISRHSFSAKRKKKEDQYSQEQN